MKDYEDTNEAGEETLSKLSEIEVKIPDLEVVNPKKHLQTQGQIKQKPTHPLVVPNYKE